MKKTLDKYYLVIEEEVDYDNTVWSRSVYLVPKDALEALSKYADTWFWYREEIEKYYDEDTYVEVKYYDLSKLPVKTKEELEKKAKEVSKNLERQIEEWEKMQEMDCTDEEVVED